MFDWPDYLDLARQLAERRSDEAAQRSAISRASYAAFGAASERLIHHGWPAQTGQLHHRVWKTYQEAGHRDCRRIGELGFNLRDQRNSADDVKALPPMFRLPDEVHKALHRAEQVLRLLGRLGSSERCF